MKSVTNTKKKTNTYNTHSVAKRKKSAMASSDGMSLVEIVVALGLLAVIMFFMSSTQLSSLKMNHKTGIIRELTHTAEREIEVLRQQPKASTDIASSAPACQFDVQDYTCTTTIHPCHMHVVAATGESTIACVDTAAAQFPETEAVSHQMVVNVIGPEERSILLQTIVEANQ